MPVCSKMTVCSNVTAFCSHFMPLINKAVQSHEKDISNKCDHETELFHVFMLMIRYISKIIQKKFVPRECLSADLDN